MLANTPRQQRVPAECAAFVPPLDAMSDSSVGEAPVPQQQVAPCHESVVDFGGKPPSKRSSWLPPLPQRHAVMPGEIMVTSTRLERPASVATSATSDCPLQPTGHVTQHSAACRCAPSIATATAAEHAQHTASSQVELGHSTTLASGAMAAYAGLPPPPPPLQVIGATAVAQDDRATHIRNLQQAARANAVLPLRYATPVRVPIAIGSAAQASDHDRVTSGTSAVTQLGDAAMLDTAGGVRGGGEELQPAHQSTDACSGFAALPQGSAKMPLTNRAVGMSDDGMRMRDGYRFAGSAPDTADDPIAPPNPAYNEHKRAAGIAFAHDASSRLANGAMRRADESGTGVQLPWLCTSAAAAGGEADSMGQCATTTSTAAWEAAPVEQVHMARTSGAAGEAAAKTGDPVNTSSTVLTSTAPCSAQHAAAVIKAHDPIPQGVCGSSTVITGLHADGFSTQGLKASHAADASLATESSSTNFSSAFAEAAGPCDPPNATLRKQDPGPICSSLVPHAAYPSPAAHVTHSLQVKLGQRRCLDSISINHTQSNVSTAALPPPDLLSCFVERWESLSTPPGKHGAAGLSRGSPSFGSIATSLNTYDTIETGSMHTTPSYLPPRLQQRMPAMGLPCPSEEPQAHFERTYMPPPFLNRVSSEPPQQVAVNNFPRLQSPRSSPKKRISGYARSMSMPSIAGGGPPSL
jgi:hypothetical protein